MANNSCSVNDDCYYLDWYKKTGGQIGFGVFYIMTPFYFTFGVLAHTLSLIAFTKQAKMDKAFIYQLMESISKLFSIVSRTINIATYAWLTGKYGDGVRWWQSCYGCVWFSATVPIATMHACFTTTELLSIFVIYNRVSALANPFHYKCTNHFRNQIFAAVFSVSVGFSTSVFQYFLYKVVHSDRSNNLYTFIPDCEYEKSMIYDIFDQARNAVRGISLLVLFIGNLSLVWLFRKHRIASRAIRSETNEREKEEAERTLTILCLCQSFFATLSMTAVISFYAYWAIKPSMYFCDGILLIPVYHGTVEFSEICDFYFAFLINRKFRKMILSAMPFFYRFLRLTRSCIS